MQYAGLFGVKRYGVHINGYCRDESGEVRMWLSRRSPTKQTYPGLLDNLVSVHCANSAYSAPEWIKKKHLSSDDKLDF